MVWFFIIAVIAVIVLAVFYIAAGKFFDFAFSKEGGKFPESNDGEDHSPWANYKEVMKRNVDEAKAENTMKDVWIQSKDGLRLHAYYYPSSSTAKRIILCAHGFHGSPFMDFGMQLPWLHRMGNLLMIDERTHGQSEGKYITFGAFEKYDIQKWCEYLHDNNPDHLPIYLYGTSMGSGTVMMTSALELPSEVKGIIADCGYTSLKDTIKDEAVRMMHFPAYPTMWFLDRMCQKRAGFRIADADAEAALRKTDIPVLFVHGTADQMVLPENSKKNYAACASQKELLMVEGAQHVCSYGIEKQTYESHAEAFFARCEKA